MKILTEMNPREIRKAYEEDAIDTYVDRTSEYQELKELNDLLVKTLKIVGLDYLIDDIEVHFDYSLQTYSIRKYDPTGNYTCQVFGQIEDHQLMGRGIRNVLDSVRNGGITF